MRPMRSCISTRRRRCNTRARLRAVPVFSNGGKQMKLSEMNTEQLAACLCKIAPVLERIGMDEATNRAFAALSEKLEGCTRMQQLAQMVGALVPALLGAHFDDMVTIVAAMTG